MPSEAGTFTLTVRSINECGTSQTIYTVTVLESSHTTCGGTMLRISPNPASTVVHIAYDGFNDLQSVFSSSQLAFSVRIVNGHSGVLLEKFSTDGSVVELDVTNLQNGLYYVLMESSLGVWQEQLLISK
ncbi:MAG: hypothetical protein EAZ57_04230 [Cytophagales bacterium]|nr:MAG: hypothetical protein EAZ67_05250 [Cytophagales bacterium]TAF61206.1 MAG: hypothetical protein EAZ57_04230 [Cytophagales bacterium]